MNTKRRTIWTLIIAASMGCILAAIGILPLTGAAQAMADGSNTHNSPAGSWIVTVTPDPQSGLPTETNIATLTEDGRIVNVEANGNVSAGSWKKTGAQRFGVTFMGLFIENDQRFRLKVRAACRLTEQGNEFEGPFTTEIFDSAGTLLFSVSGTVHATRFGVEPLD